VPAALRLLALLPRLLLVTTRLLPLLRRLTGALAPTATRLPVLAALPRLLAPTTLLRRLACPRLRLGRRLTPAASTLTGLLPTLTRLLSPASLTRLASRLTPWLPARLAPRLPRTPRSLWRRRHMRSLETHV
jgi:hypothetical protein